MTIGEIMPKPPFEQLSNRKKRAIYKTCLELFAQHGYANTSLKMINKRLRVADGYLYYYFNGKEDLARWAIEIGLAKWKEDYHDNVNRQRPHNLFALYKLSIVQMVHFVRENPDLFGAYIQLSNEPDFPLAEWMNQKANWIDEIYERAIRDDIANGKLRDDVPPTLIAMLLAVVNTRFQELVFKPTLDLTGISQLSEEELEKMIEKIVSIIEHGLSLDGR